MLYNFGALRALYTLDGDKDTLRPGDSGGCSHFALALGVLGTR